MPRKPVVSLRRERAAEAFVALDGAPGKTPPAAQTASRTAGKKARAPARKKASGTAPQEGRRLEQRAGGRLTRKQTFSLPPELVRRLRLHAADRGVDMSAIVVAALERHLGEQ